MQTESLPVELKYWPIKRYMDIYKKSLDDIEEFWEQEARKLEWFRTWDRVLDWDLPFAKWFPGGMLNASYLCVDRHLKTWRRNKVAIYWEGENGEERTLSYSQLYREVNRLAFALQKLGVKDGDRVAIYLPMIPELPIAMLATARIGAIHTVVFSGFSSVALADRINDTEAKVVITADGDANTSLSSPQTMATIPPTATTTVTAYHWVYKFLINCTDRTPSNQKYTVSLRINGKSQGILYVASDGTPATNEAVICQWDVGTEIGSPSAFIMIVRRVP